MTPPDTELLTLLSRAIELCEQTDRHILALRLAAICDLLTTPPPPPRSYQEARKETLDSH